MAAEPLLEVRNLKKYFTVRGGKKLKAVDDITFTIHRGEVFGLVGESGCGKSTAGRSIIRLYEPTGGEVTYAGENLGRVSREQIALKLQMIFQDPYASLNPRMTVGDIIAEALDIHNLAKGKQRKQRIAELLETVGLNAEHANRFPHEFSGGQRQRIGIARALAAEPEFLVADEPISALDVSVQAQIVNLMTQLQRERGLTYLFIAHDLSMVRYISDRVGVMYLGKMMELTDSNELYENPLHPYTKALLSAVPIPDPDVSKARERIVLQGDVPSPVDPPKGCRFATRCPIAEPICSQVEPEFREHRPGHFAACHLID